MAYNTPRSLLVFQSPLIDLKNTLNYTIFTPTEDFLIFSIVFNMVNLVGTQGFPITINLGWTGPSYDDFLSNFSGLASVNNTFSYTNNGTPFNTGMVPVVPASTPLVLKVSTADTIATTDTQVAYIFGFYA